MSQENVNIARRLFAELGSEGGVDEASARLSDPALAEFYDPEIEWVPAAQSLLAVDSYHGYEGVRRFFVEFLSAWDDFSIEAEELFEAGDRVAVVMRLKGRRQGIEFDERWSALLTFRNGRVVHNQGFTSREGALEAAGLSE